MSFTADKLHVKATGGEVGFCHNISLRTVEVEQNVGGEQFGVDSISGPSHIFVGAESELQGAVFYGLIGKDFANELHGDCAAAFVISTQKR